jgi:hypothetical protein
VPVLKEWKDRIGEFMRWFRHFNDARNNPKFRAIEKKLGEAGYARAFKLFEIIAERGGTGKEFKPVIDLRKPPTDLDWLAEEWKISNEDTLKSLDLFAEVRIIAPKSWRRKIVQVPQILEYLDEWTERQRLRSSTRATPESLPSHSGVTPSRSRSRGRAEVETEAEAEADETKNPAATAASLKDKSRKVLKEAWDAIGIPPLGAHSICGTWEFFYAQRAKDEPLSAVMERAIQHCQGNGVRIPKPFYDAKHRIEDEESGRQTAEEISRVAGPRGVAPELMR